MQPGLQAVAEEDDGMYDEANDDEPVDDDEKALQEALALSMMPDAPEANAAVEEKPAAADPQPQPEVDIDADLMKDVIGDLGIDIDAGQLDEIMNEAKKENDAEKDKDKDKKDDSKK